MSHEFKNLPLILGYLCISIYIHILLFWNFWSKSWQIYSWTWQILKEELSIWHLLLYMTLHIYYCRYFIQGVCREGNRCLFSHDLSTSKRSTICKFYQKGQCAYGTRCKYELVVSKRKPAVNLPCVFFIEKF